MPVSYKNRLGFAPIIIIGIIFLFSIVAGFVAFSQFKSKDSSQQPAVSNTTKPEQAIQPSVSQSLTPLSTPASNSDPNSKAYEESHYFTPRYYSKTNPSVSYTSDIDANWKAYTNTKYHYSLQFPANYVIKEFIKFDYNPGDVYVSGIFIKNPQPKTGGGYPQPLINVFVFKKDAKDLNAWLSLHTSVLPFDDPSLTTPNQVPYVIYRGIYDQTNSILGGKQAVTFKSRSFESSLNPIIADMGDYIIAVSFDNENETKDPELKNLYPQILSSFKFIN